MNLLNNIEFSNQLINTVLTSLTDKKIERIKKAIQGCITFNNYPDFECDLREFDWQSGHEQRNWWFQLQQLPTLAWATGVWPDNMEELKKNAIQYNFDVIHNWQDKHNNAGKYKKTLAWHDHASALRVLNLFNWAVFCKEDNVESKLITNIFDLIQTHIEWLLDDKNYSRHTNHGYDQAWIIIFIASYCPQATWAKSALDIAQKRLKSEVDFAFTEQGVHKENSPGYHWSMLKRLRELQSFTQDHENSSSKGFSLNQLIEKAEMFLDAIALDSCKLPLIGDTQEKEKHIKDISKLRSKLHELHHDDEEFYDYTDSGYLIWRRSSNVGQIPYHFVMKCAHLANYHRHDDDLAIHFEYDGEIILGDSGGYSHNKADLLRQYARSPYAHTTVFPDGTNTGIRKKSKLKNEPVIKWNRENQEVEGHTYQYLPLKLQRTVKFINKQGRMFEVIDHATNLSEDPLKVVTNFVIPYYDAKITNQIDLGVIGFSSNSHSFRLELEREKIIGINTIYGLGDTINQTAVISKNICAYEPITRLEIYWLATPNCENTFKWTLACKTNTH
ncbi:MAG: heparinase II/III domain-containing protein [bacterium]